MAGRGSAAGVKVCVHTGTAAVMHNILHIALPHIILPVVCVPFQRAHKLPETSAGGWPCIKWCAFGSHAF